ncbi:MAG TPA: response regulator, partial [Chloroflexota bacterium]|nr:response regulator [Chloroflexota bacterium]
MAEPLISPLRPAAEARGVAPSTAEEPTATILVCDDHAEIVEMLVSVLQLEGFQPVPAYCGADALHAVQQRHIDLVLLDKAMPDIDGFEVCRRIKEMFALRFL